MLAWKGNVDHQAMHVHNAFNGNNDKNGTERDDSTESESGELQHVDQFASSLSSACRKMGHATRSHMFRGKKEKGGGKQLHPAHRQESGEQMQFQFHRPVHGTRKERGKASPSAR